VESVLNASFCYALYLPFAQHIHHLESLQRSPYYLKGEQAHPRFRQPFDEVMSLFNESSEILYLS